MASWHVDESLAILIHDVKTAHPGIIVGTIGDPAHQTEPSDHNPDKNGAVKAADFMLGPAFDARQANALFSTLAKYLDNRMAYAIWYRQIVSTTVVPGHIRTYTGSNPHTGHVHVSVNDQHHANKSPWRISMSTVYAFVELSGHMPLISEGARDGSGISYVWRIQGYLGFTGKDRDGVWGPHTTAALKAAGFGNGTSIGHDAWQKILGMW
jgi:hypothetical protein